MTNALTPVTATGWAVMYCEDRKPRLFSQAFRTRREARDHFINPWPDRATGIRLLASGNYRIVKVRIEVAE